MTLPTKPNGAIDWDEVHIERDRIVCWGDNGWGEFTNRVDVCQFVQLVAEHVREQAAKVADARTRVLTAKIEELKTVYGDQDEIDELASKRGGVLMIAAEIRKMEV